MRPGRDNRDRRDDLTACARRDRGECRDRDLVRAALQPALDVLREHGIEPDAPPV